MINYNKLVEQHGKTEGHHGRTSNNYQNSHFCEVTCKIATIKPFLVKDFLQLFIFCKYLQYKDFFPIAGSFWRRMAVATTQGALQNINKKIRKNSL